MTLFSRTTEIILPFHSTIGRDRAFIWHVFPLHITSEDEAKKISDQDPPNHWHIVEWSGELHDT